MQKDFQFYFSPKYIFAAFAGVALLHFIAACTLDLMDIDATQYASISMEMLQNQSYLQVLHRGENYLDKPPLLFWTSALSFKLFGISNFSYRLFSICILFLGVYATYKLSLMWYSRFVSILAAFILFTTQAIFLMMHDVRTDTMLCGWVVFSVWQTMEYIKSKKWSSLFFASLGIAAAMLEKGPIGLMVPLLAVGGQLLYQRNWKELFNPSWLLVVLLVLLILTPMMWGLYVQHGINGLRFFWWTQSFGRITGESSWKNDTSFFYFTHVFLWSFLPWSILAIPAIFGYIKNGVSSILKPDRSMEVLTVSGFLLPFIALSFSNYKLPHYIFVLYPFTAIMTAVFIHKLIEGKKTIMTSVCRYFQLFICLVIWLVIFLICFWVFKLQNSFIWLILSGCLILFLWFISRKHISAILIAASTISSVAINTVMCLHFYPHVIHRYQAGSIAGQWVLENGYANDKLHFLNTNPHSFDFYSKRINPIIKADQLIPQYKKYKGHVFYTSHLEIEQLKQHAIPFEELKRFEKFPASSLNGKFLNPNTRQEAITYTYLIRIL